VIDEQSEKENNRQIAMWKREILQRISGPKKENDSEWIIRTSSKWILL
jgi:hypothetical protein